MLCQTNDSLFWVFQTHQVYRVRYNNPFYMCYAPKGTDPIDLEELFDYLTSMSSKAVVKAGDGEDQVVTDHKRLSPRTKFYMADLDELIKMRLIFGASIQVHRADFSQHSNKTIWRDIDDGADCTI